MMQPASGAVIAGRFRLERLLSRGGMGSVWVARHTQLGHPVAIKLMHRKYAALPAFRARFKREARAAANLRSHHVVQVQDYGVEAGIPWLVMELLEGEDLGARLRRCGRITFPEALRILVQAGKALRRAHDAGLVHRDLKPSNLFLARLDDDEVVKILDFGIAKHTRAGRVRCRTRTGELLGSPCYMSPEQIRGDKRLDLRSDLWSLGVILFRAVTGDMPFCGEALGTVIAKILVDPIPKATALAPHLPPTIDAFFAKALARDRAQRFQSVREMLAALECIASDPPPAAPAPSPVPPVEPVTLSLDASPLPMSLEATAPGALAGIPAKRPRSRPRLAAPRRSKH